MNGHARQAKRLNIRCAPQKLRFPRWTCVCALGIVLQISSSVVATDYFLVLGGGYNRQANQASLEANVLFFREVLNEQHRGSRVTTTFFADGLDKEADLQVLKALENSRTPATDFLTRVFSYRSTRQSVEYRNHRVPNISGALRPESIEGSLKQQATQMRAGDRLFVYVTSHGGSAKGRDKYNTTISCWNKQSISVRTFETWLQAVPADVPVVMVMAQCYCGGFAHAIFDKASDDRGFASQLRVGFFAQQHDLAAAGCRPDIDNDEEYSSYFLGAIAGRSRTGKPIEQVDLDGNGRVSLSEAHAYAVVASGTIDIPLRSTECLLRTYSRIGNYERRGDGVHTADRRPGVEEQSEPQGESPETPVPDLAGMTGTIQELAARGRPDQRAIVTSLTSQLGMQIEEDVAIVFEHFAEQMSARRYSRRGSFRRGDRGSSRRSLSDEIAEHWPELGDRDHWRESTLLRLDNQASLFQELQLLPSYEQFEDSQAKRKQASQEAEQAEVRQVKFQRLINTLEAIVLAENLPRLATDEVVQRYQQMLRLEESYLQAKSETLTSKKL